jgi:hypothetical protein
MNTQPEALKLADALDSEIKRAVKLNLLYSNAADYLRHLYKTNQELTVMLDEAMGKNK